MNTCLGCFHLNSECVCAARSAPIIVGAGPRVDPRDAELASLRAELTEARETDAFSLAMVDEQNEANGLLLATIETLRAELAAAESAIDEQRERAKRAEAEVERIKSRPVGVPGGVRQTILSALAYAYAGNITPAHEKRPVAMFARYDAEAWLASTADVAPNSCVCADIDPSDRPCLVCECSGADVATSERDAQWRTMDECPEGVVIVRCDRGHAPWVALSYDGKNDKRAPTHWMPLPKPPEVSR